MIPTECRPLEESLGWFYRDQKSVKVKGQNNKPDRIWYNLKVTADKWWILLLKKKIKQKENNYLIVNIYHQSPNSKQNSKIGSSMIYWSHLHSKSGKKITPKSKIWSEISSEQNLQCYFIRKFFLKIQKSWQKQKNWMSVPQKRRQIN